jgi:hypothetical protein
VALATVVLGCGTFGTTDPVATSTDDAVHVTPAAAGVLVTGDPATAADAFDVELVDLAASFDERQAIAPGTRIVAEFFVGAGRYRLRAGDGSCTLELELQAGRHTDVVAHHVADGSCTLEVVREHAADDGSHEEGGTLDARVTARPDGVLLVEVASLDEPANPVPAPVAPDERGVATIFALLPGDYVANLLRNDVVIESVPFTVQPADADGTPGGDLVGLVLDGLPD